MNSALFLALLVATMFVLHVIKELFRKRFTRGNTNGKMDHGTDSTDGTDGNIIMEKTYTSSFPRAFIESQFPKDMEAQTYKDRYIGTFMNAGVIYDEAFVKRQNAPSRKDPASFTPYADDYNHYVERPPPKPFPTF